MGQAMPCGIPLFGEVYHMASEPRLLLPRAYHGHLTLNCINPGGMSIGLELFGSINILYTQPLILHISIHTRTHTHYIYIIIYNIYTHIYFIYIYTHAHTHTLYIYIYI